jgi:ribose transport system substrate-binding protein
MKRSIGMFRLRTAALAAALTLPAALALIAPAGGQGKTTIGVSLAQDDNPFYIAMLRGIRARAQELGWDVATVSANEDKLKQINGVQDLVARGVKGILISPIDAVGVNAAYDAAAVAKIPIVSVARGSASPNQTIHVAMDEKQIGRDIAEWTAQKLGGKGKVALLMGPSGAPTFKRAPRKISATHPTPQNCPQMIPVRSRSDSLTFTPRLHAIGIESNFSRCPRISATATAR